MKEILELVQPSTEERPIKGFALDKAIYIADTKQSILDEQAISNKRVASLVVWARDAQKFIVFSEDGASYEEKDLPSGDFDISQLVETGSTAQLSGFEIAYEGIFGDGRNYHPATLKQDYNGWVQVAFTSDMVFKTKNKDSGVVGDKVLELTPHKVISHKQPYFGTEKMSTEAYVDDTERRLINEISSHHKEWLPVSAGTLTPYDSRPTGNAAEGEFAIWHLNVADSTTNPLNEFKIFDTAAYPVVENLTAGRRYKLVQGDKVQYWDTLDNGWVTSANTWHLSAVGVYGDDLFADEQTEIYVEVDKQTPRYRGEGLGVPQVQLVSVNPITQTEPVRYYQNDTPRDGEMVINLHSTDYDEFRVIINGGGSGNSNRWYRIKLDDDVSFTKQIRNFETWEARIQKNASNIASSTVFWARIDDGSVNTFTEAANIAMFKMAVSSQNTYGTQLSIDLRGN